MSLRGAPATKQSPDRDPEIAARPAGARNDTGAPIAAEGASPSTAVDPICGMTVDVARSRHQAEHAGVTYHFCCGGCRERFLADPQRYVEAKA
jgi:YHS domain-containing protein